MPSPSSVFASPVADKDAPWGPRGPTFSAESPNNVRQPHWGSGVFSVGSGASLASPCASFSSDARDISLELSFDSPDLNR